MKGKEEERKRRKKGERERNHGTHFLLEKYSTKVTILCQEIGMISQTFPSKFSHIPFQVEQLLEINSSHVQSTMLVNSNSFTVCGENFVLAVDQD